MIMRHVPEGVLYTRKKRSAEKGNKLHIAVTSYITNSDADTRNSRRRANTRGPRR